MRVQDLERTVEGLMLAAEVNHIDLGSACVQMPIVQWRRLPIYTDLVFDGQPLQRFIGVTTDLTLNEFLGVYEEFVAGFLLSAEYRRLGMQTWLCKKLRITAGEAHYLFSNGAPRRGRRAYSVKDMMRALATLAVVAHDSFGGAIVHNDGTRFVVGAGECIFGTADGCPITNMGNNRIGPFVASTGNRYGLINNGRHGVEAEESEISMYGMLNAWVQCNPDRLGENTAEAWIVALTALRQFSLGGNSNRLKRAIAECRDPMFIKQALRLASGFEGFDTPWSEMRLLLVPGVVSDTRYRNLFGLSPGRRPTPENYERWRVAIDQLSEINNKKLRRKPWEKATEAT